MSHSPKKKVIIVGGGAAGFFTAINIAEKQPHLEVTILEKTSKLLSKVKVSGGGRCNVTNARQQPSELTPFYPRGGKKLYPVFKEFSTSDMVSWLSDRGVQTHTEADLRMFPITNSSQTIIDCFTSEAARLGVKVIQNCGVKHLEASENQWKLDTTQGIMLTDKLVMATGSTPSVWGLLGQLGLELVPPVPSLFTFNIKDPRISGLMGITFPEVNIRITGTKLEETGPLLITHWGLSGPAVLKLSAWGARELSEKGYHFQILVNYLGKRSNTDLRQWFDEQKQNHPKRRILNYPPGELTKRFWEQLCAYCDIPEQSAYGEISKKQVNKLTEELTQGLYEVKGKSTFKEEFVTSGGVNLSEVNLQTFEARRFPNLYLAGEVLDIDALTGGFNFQACWSAGWVISEHFQKSVNPSQSGNS
ncbi:MAG: NAD(P)/FAD-dependent oxidoreductase [Marinoscillum sp.]|uniref:NAD(P)/FAD-dependent oxidoreductase n=1 Tax=Marinoscillum sp. TaxID=2024838 RepID=UPI0032F99936